MHFGLEHGHNINEFIITTSKITKQQKNNAHLAVYLDLLKQDQCSQGCVLPKPCIMGILYPLQDSNPLQGVRCGTFWPGITPCP